MFFWQYYPALVVLSFWVYLCVDWATRLCLMWKRQTASQLGAITRSTDYWTWLEIWMTDIFKCFVCVCVSDICWEDSTCLQALPTCTNWTGCLFGHPLIIIRWYYNNSCDFQQDLFEFWKILYVWRLLKRPLQFFR